MSEQIIPNKMALFESFEVFMILVFMIYIYYIIDRRRKKPMEPTMWPVVGMLPAVLQNMHRIHDYITDVLNACGGTYKFKGPWFCNLEMLFTSDPANIHHIFSKNFSNYPKGPEFRKIFDILGDGIFNADFELWEVHRKTTLSVLRGQSFYRSLERTVWEKVETGLLPVLDHLFTQGNDVDLQEIFQRFAFDNICKIVLDYDPNTLCVELPYNPCEKAFSNSLEPLLYRHIIPESIWKVQNRLKIGREKILIQSALAFDRFIYPLVYSNKAEQRNEDGGPKVLTVFQKVYKEKDIGSSRRLGDFLKDTSLNLMIAGRDTTSTCLTWLFYLIALNPSSQTKIFQEIESELDMKETKKWRFFSSDEAGKLVYLHGALCESLRMFPPVALEHKAPIRPDVLPSGHRLHKNAKIIVSLYSVGRMEMVWGKDCLEFKPERWITPRGGIKHEPSYRFPAFNVGPRTCLGKEMAFVQMKMVAATIVYHYQIELVEGHPVAPRDSIILQAKNGLRVSLFRRNV